LHVHCPPHVASYHLGKLGIHVSIIEAIYCM
jgi:hypothetical protein